jgi:hypothetical protein
VTAEIGGLPGVARTQTMVAFAELQGRDDYGFLNLRLDAEDLAAATYEAPDQSGGTTCS